MQLKKPFKMIYRNMILTPTNEVWAYYRIPGKTISENDEEDLEGYKRQISQTLIDLDQYSEFDFQMVPEDMQLNERLMELERDFSPEMRAIGEKYDDRMLDALTSQLGEVTRYGFNMGVKLRNYDYLNQATVKETAKSAVNQVSAAILGRLGADLGENAAGFQPYLASEQEVLGLLSRLKAQALSSDQLYRLTTAAFSRGIQETERQDELLTTNTNLDSVTNAGYLHLENENGTSVMTCLPVIKTETAMTYLELFKRVQELAFPVELKIKARRLRPGTSKRKTELANRRFKETNYDMENLDERDQELIQGRQYLQDLKNDLLNNQVSLFEWVAVFIIYGKDKAECNWRYKRLKSYLANYQVKIARPLADQLNLFYALLNGASEHQLHNWKQYTKTDGLAELLFGLNNVLGTNVGFYLGRVTHSEMATTSQDIQGSRDIVLFHPMIANEGIQGSMTDSPHMLISGQTGKGKSFLAKLAMFYATFLKVRILMTDPKNENRAWFEQALQDPQIRTQYPEFMQLIKSFHYVTLDPNDPANNGALDPLTFLTGAQAKDTAIALIEQIYDLTNKDAIKKAILDELDHLLALQNRGEKVGMLKLIEALEKDPNPAVSDAGGLLAKMISNSILQLAFSDGISQGLDISHKHTILSIQDLRLPDSDMRLEEMNDSDRKALAVMIPLAKYCQYFGQRDRREKTSIIFDEAWTLTATKGGQRLVKELKRVGRSYNNQLLMITQSIKDTQKDDEEGNFGACFAFDESTERPEILKFMGLPVTKVNLERLQALKQGQCLFKDIYGRVDVLSVDCLFPEWQQAFKTVEKSNSAQAELAFAQ